MALTDPDRERALKQAHDEGVIWRQSAYYDQAEKVLASQWPEFIWPLICDCDFSSVVDLAAGHGRNSERLRGLAQQITVVDINQENVDFCRQRFAGDRKFHFITNDGCGLRELADNSVSLIYCFDAMVHFDSDVIRMYLAEFRRVLKPGGRGFCHHSNYTGNPAGDFRQDLNWRNFMSQQLFHHYCAKEGLTVVRSRVMDWTGAAEHDCLTVFEKAVPQPAAKFVAAGVGPASTVRRKHLRVVVVSSASPSSGVDADNLVEVYGASVVVHLPPRPANAPGAVALDASSWCIAGQEIASAAVEASVADPGSTGAVVCRLELRGGERGAGVVLGHAEITVAPCDGWVRLEAAVPEGREARSLVLATRTVDPRNANEVRATYRDMRILTRAAAAPAPAGRAA